MADCGARQPGGVLRCEDELGHKGDHVAAGSAGNVRWPTSKKERQTFGKQPGRSSGGGLTTRSRPQEYRQGRLAGITDERLFQQRAAYERGERWAILTDGSKAATNAPFWCQGCGKGYYDLGIAKASLALHHVVQRSLGTKATPNNGEDHDERPQDLALICQGIGSCHDAEHE